MISILGCSWPLPPPPFLFLYTSLYDYSWPLLRSWHLSMSSVEKLFVAVLVIAAVQHSRTSFVCWPIWYLLWDNDNAIWGLCRYIWIFLEKFYHGLMVIVFASYHCTTPNSRCLPRGIGRKLHYCARASLEETKSIRSTYEARFASRCRLVAHRDEVDHGQVHCQDEQGDNWKKGGSEHNVGKNSMRSTAKLGCLRRDVMCLYYVFYVLLFFGPTKISRGLLNGVIYFAFPGFSGNSWSSFHMMRFPLSTKMRCSCQPKSTTDEVPKKRVSSM